MYACWSKKTYARVLPKRARISRVHLANVESADSAPHHRNPSLSVLERIAKALGGASEELLE